MAPEEDYFSRFLKEGAACAEDTAFAPELQHLLGKLYKRQRYEAQELHLEQGEDVRRIGTPHHPVLNRGHLRIAPRRTDASSRNANGISANITMRSGYASSCARPMWRRRRGAAGKSNHLTFLDTSKTK